MASTTQLIEKLLQEHGAEYDENVVMQLNEYAFRYMKSILQTAEETVSYRAERKCITEDDLKYLHQSYTH
jgi:histone H3/H4